jgi:uncharacterized protein (DUF362 family)
MIVISITRFMTCVAIVDIENDVFEAVKRVFELTTRGEDLIKNSGEVYLKPNLIDFKPYAFTDPKVVHAVIRYFYECGASEIFLMENSTQANMTRLVFEFTGYKQMCKELGVKPIFLDEEPVSTVKLPHFEKPIEFPRLIIEKFVNEPELHTYVSLPKLKTHSMSTVTLGVKNQMAFPSHKDRGYHHGDELHRLLADFYAVVRPNYTLIDGTQAVFNGHYPLQTFLSESLDSLDILIGGADTLATDVIGAKVLGYDIDEVKHLALVRDDSGGVGNLSQIEVKGDLSRFTKKYPCDIFDKMPEDVLIIRGKEKLCPEGCDLNVRMVLQMLYYDYGGKGGFTIVMGKGFDHAELEAVTGKILIAGDCAIEETKEFFFAKLGKKNVFTSPTCNRLAATTSALCKLMDVSVLDLVPSKLTAIKTLLQGKLHGSRALVPDLF